ncbi:pilus assembly protein TadG-related protein [Paeniglutamicibacter sp. NPDC012692]|uniref:pilus assembly protein TadG-related protein n=1 Tax=Paeniglutamicibacter sp. NPDC012692 TaxID=3364388 RepID=UPI0036C2204D
MWRVIKISRQPLRSNEQGASSIIVAIMMVVLLGFAAISIDVGKLYWEKAQLQNGADAGALALASICAKSESDPACNSGSTLPGVLANDNSNDKTSLISSFLLDTANNKVTVATSAAEAGAAPNAVSTWFAGILNPAFSNVGVGATATAIWGPPKSLTAKFPLAFSSCEVDSSPTFDGSLQFLMSHGINDKKGSDACHSTSSGHEIPGGFGWLVEDPSGSCSAKTSIGTWEPADSGNNFPKGCPGQVTAWQKALEAGKQVIVLLPVFDDKRKVTGDGEYHIYAYAAIDVRGWTFNGHTNDYLPAEAKKVMKDGGYKPSDLGIVGKFIRYVFDDEDAEFGGDGVDYGSHIYKLSE